MKNNINNTFYTSKSIAFSSKRGYYPEKINFILQHLSLLEKKYGKMEILDVACNDGVLSSIYAEHGNLTGIDINNSALKMCRKRGINCLQKDIGDLSEKYNNYFDVVIAGDIIEHIFDTDTFLENIKRVMKKDGILFITTPNLASFPRRLMLLMGMNPFIEYSTRLPYKEINVGHIRYYTLDNLKRQVKGIGFRNIRVVGDKINLAPKISVSYSLARYFPSLSRNLMLVCNK